MNPKGAQIAYSTPSWQHATFVVVTKVQVF